MCHYNETVHILLTNGATNITMNILYHFVFVLEEARYQSSIHLSRLLNLEREVCLPKLYFTFKDLQVMTDFVSLESYTYMAMFGILRPHTDFNQWTYSTVVTPESLNSYGPMTCFTFFCHNHGVVHLCVKMQ